MTTLTPLQISRETYNTAAAQVRHRLETARLLARITSNTENEALRALSIARSTLRHGMERLDPKLKVYDPDDAVRYFKGALSKCEAAIERGGLSGQTQGRAASAIAAMQAAIEDLEAAREAREASDRLEREIKAKNFARDRDRHQRFEERSAVLSMTADILDHFGIQHEIKYVTPVDDLAAPLLSAAETAKDRRFQNVVDKLTAASQAASASKIHALWFVLYEIERELEKTPDKSQGT